jgi:hypothetical protein
MVGAFFEYPMPASNSHPGFHGASEIIDHEELYDRLRRGGDAVDVEAFLRARLLDILIGDFDRHRKQWRWAKLPGDARWQPIPEDRDMAFVRYEGVVVRAAAFYVPILQNYGPDYPSMQGLTLHGWEQDRWLLPALSWEQWEPIALDLQARVTDETIDAAIQSLPPEYIALDGERLRADLRGRRDRLPEGARSYYEHLARQVDVQASDASEEVAVSRSADGSMLVEIVERESARAASGPVYSRRFEADATRDVRIHLRDGDDRVTVTGAPGCIRLRVIAGGGQKLLDDSAGGGSRLYDEAGTVTVEPGPGTRVHRKPYEPPESDSGFVDVEDVPPRDWGSDLIFIPQFGYERDTGVVLGVGAIYKRYGFRKDPWSSRYLLTAGWATEAKEPRIRFKSSFRPENSKLVAELDTSFSGIEVLRWYGFGNAEDRIRLSGGPWVEHSDTEDGSRLIDFDDPYGSGSFGSIGAFANLQFDTRRSTAEAESGLVLPFHEYPVAGYPISGFLIDFTAEVSPPVWDVESTWGAIEGSASAFLTLGAKGLDEKGRATLALRVGGRETFGTIPYFKAAFIGGGDFFSGGPSVRGYRDQRFAGNSSFFADFELRLFLARIKLLIPGDFGILGFADVGRVFLDGESSNKWHPGYGGGLWFAPLARVNDLSISVAGSKEEALFSLRFGFHW